MILRPGIVSTRPTINRINMRGGWVQNTSYALGDSIVESGKRFECSVAGKSAYDAIQEPPDFATKKKGGIVWETAGPPWTTSSASTRITSAAGTPSCSSTNGAGKAMFGPVNNYYGRLYYTGNYGTSYSARIVTGLVMVSSVLWVSGSVWLAGGYTSNGYGAISRTTDDGVTWTLIFVSSEIGGGTSNYGMTGLEKISDTEVVASGRWVYHSTDGGCTWHTQFDISADDTKHFSILKCGTTRYVLIGFYSAFYCKMTMNLVKDGSVTATPSSFVTTATRHVWLENGYAYVGDCPTAYMMKSTDNGDTWTRLAAVANGGICALSDIPGGILRGGTSRPNTLYRSIDYGANWGSVDGTGNVSYVRSLIYVGNHIVLAATNTAYGTIKLTAINWKNTSDPGPILTVIGGTGSGEKLSNDSCLVSCTPGDGQVLNKWNINSGDATITDPYTQNASVLLGDQDTTVEPSYTSAGMRVLTVTYGTGSGSYQCNEQISVVAEDRTAQCWRFAYWKIVSGDAIITDPLNSTASVRIRTQDATVEAIYVEIGWVSSKAYSVSNSIRESNHIFTCIKAGTSDFPDNKPKFADVGALGKVPDAVGVSLSGVDLHNPGTNCAYDCYSDPEFLPGYALIKHQAASMSLYYTEDYGQTLNQCSGSLPTIDNFEPSYVSSSIWLICGRTGAYPYSVKIYRSTDKGQNWSAVLEETNFTNAIPNCNCVKIGSKVVCITPVTIWVSSDDGATWQVGTDMTQVPYSRVKSNYGWSLYRYLDGNSILALEQGNSGAASKYMILDSNGTPANYTNSGHVYASLKVGDWSQSASASLLIAWIGNSVYGGFPPSWATKKLSSLCMSCFRLSSIPNTNNYFPVFVRQFTAGTSPLKFSRTIDNGANWGSDINLGSAANFSDKAVHIGDGVLLIGYKTDTTHGRLLRVDNLLWQRAD